MKRGCRTEYRDNDVKLAQIQGRHGYSWLDLALEYKVAEHQALDKTREIWRIAPVLEVSYGRPQDIWAGLNEPEDRTSLAPLVSWWDLVRRSGEVDGGTSFEEAEDARVMHAGEYGARLCRWQKQREGTGANGA